LQRKELDKMAYKRSFSKKCLACNKDFKGIYNQIYCSSSCYKEKNERYVNIYKNLSTGTIGAIGELRVCADLLSKGYEVFRALSPSCSCDLLASKNGKTHSIEVKTSNRYKSGKLYYPNPASIKATHLALVLPNEIIYLPKL
jgi:hypothetical protein